MENLKKLENLTCGKRTMIFEAIDSIVWNVDLKLFNAELTTVENQSLADRLTKLLTVDLLDEISCTGCGVYGLENQVDLWIFEIQWDIDPKDVLNSIYDDLEKCGVFDYGSWEYKRTDYEFIKPDPS